MSGFGFDTIDTPPKMKPESLLLLKLTRQKCLIVMVSIPLFFCLAIGVQLLPRVYKASSQVTVESRTPRPPVRGSDVEMPITFTEDVIGTEMAVLSSREILSEVVTKLHLDEDSHFNPSIAPGRFQRVKQLITALVEDHVPLDLNVRQPGADRAWSDTVDALARSVKFTPLPRSRVIEITTSTWQPKLAAEISNLIGDLYIATHFDLTREMNVDANKFLTKRLAELQASATEAAEAVEAYRLQAGLSTGATSTLMQEQVSQVERQLLDARARQEALQTQYESAKNRNPEQLSIAVNSPTMTRLRDFEASTSAKATEIRSRFGPQSPQLVAYASTLANVRTQIAAEARRAVQGLKTDLDSAIANVASLVVRAADLKKQLGRMDGARAHLETLQAQSNAAYSLYTAFLNRSKETDASLLFPSTDVRLVSRATVPARAAFPQNLYMLPASALGSIAMASLIGLLVENRRKGIVSSSEIDALFSLPTLGMIPIHDPKLPNINRDVFEHLLNRIHFGMRAKRVLITSAFPDEGKTTTAKALAEAASERGLRVILVDGDLRSFDRAPKSGRSSFGFAEVLRGDMDADEAMELVPQSSLAILPSGRTRDNPLRLLSLPSARDVFERLSDEFDLVIIDGPPVMVGGDCWMLSQHVDRTIMIVKWGATPPTAVGTALKQLTPPRYADDLPPNPVSGIVFNMVDRTRSRKLDNADSVMFAPAVYRYHQQGRWG